MARDEEEDMELDDVVEFQVETMTTCSINVFLYSWYAILMLALVVQSVVGLQWQARDLCTGAEVSFYDLGSWNSSGCAHRQTNWVPVGWEAEVLAEASPSPSTSTSMVTAGCNEENRPFFWDEGVFASLSQGWRRGALGAVEDPEASLLHPWQNTPSSSSVPGALGPPRPTIAPYKKVYHLRWTASSFDTLLNRRWNRFMRAAVSLASPMDNMTPAKLPSRKYRVVVALEETSFTPDEDEGGSSNASESSEGSEEEDASQEGGQSSSSSSLSSSSASASTSPASVKYSFNATVTCYRNYPRCDTLVLPPTIAVGSSNSSRFTVTLLGVNAELGEASAGTAVGFVYQRAPYTMVTLVWRYLFLCYSFLAVCRLLSRARQQHQRHGMAYEQYWTLALQFGLFLYLDPLFAVGVLHPSRSSSATGSGQQQQHAHASPPPSLSSYGVTTAFQSTGGGASFWATPSMVSLTHFMEFHVPNYFAALCVSFGFAVIAASFDWPRSHTPHALSTRSPDRPRVGSPEGGDNRRHYRPLLPTSAAVGRSPALGHPQASHDAAPSSSSMVDAAERHHRGFPPCRVTVALLGYILVIVALDVTMIFLEHWRWGTEATCSSRTCSILRMVMQTCLGVGVAVGCLALLWLRRDLSSRSYLETRPQQLACCIFIFVFFTGWVYVLVQALLVRLLYPQIIDVVVYQPMIQLSPLMVASFFVNHMTVVYTSRRASKEVPPRPGRGKGAWKLMVWPQRWFRWLRWHGGSQYIFLSEQEERVFAALQARGKVPAFLKKKAAIECDTAQTIPNSSLGTVRRGESIRRGASESGIAGASHPTAAVSGVADEAESGAVASRERSGGKRKGGRQGKGDVRSCPPTPRGVRGVKRAVSASAAAASSFSSFSSFSPFSPRPASRSPPTPVPGHEGSFHHVGEEEGAGEEGEGTAAALTRPPSSSFYTASEQAGADSLDEDLEDDPFLRTVEEEEAPLLPPPPRPGPESSAEDDGCGADSAATNAVSGEEKRLPSLLLLRGPRRVLGGALRGAERVVVGSTGQLMDFVEDGLVDSSLHALSLTSRLGVPTRASLVTPPGRWPSTSAPPRRQQPRGPPGQSALHERYRLRMRQRRHHSRYFFNLETAIDCFNMAWEAYAVMESRGDAVIPTGIDGDTDSVPGLVSSVFYALLSCYFGRRDSGDGDGREEGEREQGVQVTVEGEEGERGQPQLAPQPPPPPLPPPSASQIESDRGCGIGSGRRLPPPRAPPVSGRATEGGRVVAQTPPPTAPPPYRRSLSFSPLAVEQEKRDTLLLSTSFSSPPSHQLPQACTRPAPTPPRSPDSLRSAAPSSPAPAAEASLIALSADSPCPAGTPTAMHQSSDADTSGKANEEDERRSRRTGTAAAAASANGTSPASSSVASHGRPPVLTMPEAPLMNQERYGYQRLAVFERRGVQVVVTRMDAAHPSHRGKFPRLVVAFRGTDNIANAMQDIRFARRTWKEMERGVLSRRALVHSGFLETWMALKEQVLTTVFTELRNRFGLDESATGTPADHAGPARREFRGITTAWRRPPPSLSLSSHGGSSCTERGGADVAGSRGDRAFDAALHPLESFYDTVYITGHSLGGALACLCAYSLHRLLLLTQYPNPELVVYTYGQPRIGNHTFQRLYNRAVPQTFRVVNESDAVSGLNVFGGHHVGTEVLIDRHGNVMARPMAVERLFRPMRRRTLEAVTSHSMVAYAASLNAVADRQHRNLRVFPSLFPRSPSPALCGDFLSATAAAGAVDAGDASEGAAQGGQSRCLLPYREWRLESISNTVSDHAEEEGGEDGEHAAKEKAEAEKAATPRCGREGTF